jgi:hypothetical protein
VKADGCRRGEEVAEAALARVTRRDDGEVESWRKK